MYLLQTACLPFLTWDLNQFLDDVFIWRKKIPIRVTCWAVCCFQIQLLLAILLFCLVGAEPASFLIQRTPSSNKILTHSCLASRDCFAANFRLFIFASQLLVAWHLWEKMVHGFVGRRSSSVNFCISWQVKEEAVVFLLSSKLTVSHSSVFYHHNQWRIYIQMYVGIIHLWGKVSYYSKPLAICHAEC